MTVLMLPRLLAESPLATARPVSPSVHLPARGPSTDVAPVAPELGLADATLRLIVVVLEAMRGRRAVHQLSPIVRNEPLKAIAAVVQAGDLRDCRVVSIRTQTPSTTAVEAVVRIVTDGRSRACAIRLDRAGTVWSCTAVLLLP